MKYLFFTGLVLFFVSIFGYLNRREYMTSSDNNVDTVIIAVAICNTSIEESKVIDLESLFQAMCHIESNNGLKTIGDNGKAIGILQMHEICVKEINQKCYGYDKWIWSDANCPNNSKEMFMTYSNWLIDNRYHKYKDLMSEEEYIARVWNGGYRISSNTDQYWNKVSKFLEI